jgi:hypothetical protein
MRGLSVPGLRKEYQMSSNQKFTLEKIKALLGPPPLIKGESEEAYSNWWGVFVAEFEPESFSDWLDVHQLAKKHWEQERLNRCNTALLNNVLLSALTDLLTTFNSAKPGSHIAIPSAVAHAYYAGDKRAMEEARKKVASCGVTDDHILAEALRQRAKELILFDRLDSNRANASRAIRKELDRRSDVRRKGSAEKPSKDPVSTAIQDQDWAEKLDVNLDGRAQN